jgi:hypothetical protein
VVRVFSILRPKQPAVRGQAITRVACRRRQKKYESPQDTLVAAAQPTPPGHRRAAGRPSVGASPAAPLGGIRQHEQVPTGEQLQGKREPC